VNLYLQRAGRYDYDNWLATDLLRILKELIGLKQFFVRILDMCVLPFIVSAIVIRVNSVLSGRKEPVNVIDEAHNLISVALEMATYIVSVALCVLAARIYLQS